MSPANVSESALPAKHQAIGRGGVSWLPSLGWTVLASIALAALALGGFRAWRFIDERVRQQSRFRVDWERVEVTPLPAWLQTDLLSEVRALAGLPEPLNTLEPRLASKIRDAFALHPWVREVVEVRVIHPATVRVKLAYREPVALVRTAQSIEPVDREAVLLPTKDLRDPELYLTISGVRSTPTGPAGTKWDDAAVEAAAAVAEVMSAQHRKLALTTLDVSTYRPTASGSGNIYLLTEQGTKVKWGRPPGEDYPGEVSPQDKIERLLKYNQDNGSLDAPQGPYELDVTHAQEIVRRPRGATTAPPALPPSHTRPRRSATTSGVRVQD